MRPDGIMLPLHVTAPYFLDGDTGSKLPGRPILKEPDAAMASEFFALIKE